MYNIASELTLIFHLMQQDTNQRDDDKTLIGVIHKPRAQLKGRGLAKGPFH